MHRPALAFAFLALTLTATGQPAREALLRDVRHDEERVQPKFVALTAAQLQAQATAALLEIDDGVMVVHSVEIELPKAHNSHYATAEFEPPDVRDARGATVAIERQNGMLNPTRDSVEHRLLTPGGEAAAQFSTVRGRATIRYPLRVDTRIVKSGDRDSLTRLGATIDGPFVRYRRSLVAEKSWGSEVDPVRAFDADGKPLVREGTYPDRVNGDGFEMVAFHGAPAMVELDVAGETATLIVEYDLTRGDRKASKITKSLEVTTSAVAAAPAATDSASALAELKRMNYPAIDADQLLAATANGDRKAVALLLGAGVQVDARGNSGMTALHVAAQLGREEIVDLLLAAGANVNATDINGLTALFGLTFRCDQAGLVKKLIAKGADVNARGNSPASPLAMAKSMNCTAIVEALTGAGAK